MNVEKELHITYQSLERIEGREPSNIKEMFEKMQELAKIRKLIKLLEQEAGYEI